MTRSAKAVRFMGISMLFIGICIAVITVLNADNAAGYIIEGAPALSALLAGVHMLFMHGKDRPQWLMPAAFFVLVAVHGLMIAAVIVLGTVLVPQAIISSYGSLISLALTGIVMYLICGISLIKKGRFKSAAVAAMMYDTAMAVYGVITGFSALALITVIRSALMNAYMILSPGRRSEAVCGGKKAVAAALVLLVVGALMHIADIGSYFVTVEGEIEFRIIAIYAAPVLAACCFVLYSCKSNSSGLLPAGFLMMAMPTILNIVFSIIDGSFYIHYIMILMLVCAALCRAGCFIRRRALWEAAMFFMAVYLISQMGQYVDYLLSTILCFVNYTAADIMPTIWYALEVLISGIGVMLYLVAGGSKPTVSINFKLPVSQPSTLEYDLSILKQRFDAGELTEEEYDALRTERLELP